ncbi:hypothetical protein fh0823_04110 [Francisella halioticida]|nr:hypothetical protein fh0823_04110 [Francisella halioticida]
MILHNLKYKLKNDLLTVLNTYLIITICAIFIGLIIHVIFKILYWFLEKLRNFSKDHQRSEYNPIVENKYNINDLWGLFL